MTQAGAIGSLVDMRKLELKDRYELARAREVAALLKWLTGEVGIFGDDFASCQFNRDMVVSFTLRFNDQIYHYTMIE